MWEHGLSVSKPALFSSISITSWLNTAMDLIFRLAIPSSRKGQLSSFHTDKRKATRQRKKKVRGQETTFMVQIQSTICFCTACKLRLIFIFLNSWKYQKRDNLSWQGIWYQIQMSVSLNKVLLGHSHAHSFMNCLWLRLRQS